MSITIKASIKSKCALGKTPENGSCLTEDHIQLINENTNQSVDSVKTLKKNLECKDDKCVMEKIELPEILKKRICREAFKAPADSLDGNYWMNNTEIDTCLSQMRIQFPGFAHTFIHMSDMVAIPPSDIKTYSYKVSAFKDVDLAKCIYQTINGNTCPQFSTYKDVPLTSIGTVFNTDSSDKSGQHWFAVYISLYETDIEDPSKNMITIEIFNSSGLDIRSDTFQNFWEDARVKISKATGLRCDKKLVSNIQHQRDDTGNCGSYSLFYIISRLNGVPAQSFNEAKVLDKKMEEFRKICFEKGNQQFTF